MTTEQQTQLAQLEETIRQAQQQIEELKKSKPKKFEWEYGYTPSVVGNAGTYIIGSNKPQKGDSFIEHGRYRLTKESAEQSLSRNKRANRLEALAEQLGGLKVFEYEVYNYYIFKNICSGEWQHAWASHSNYPEAVYMTLDCANEICRMLNEGEFSLDEEL